MNKGFTLVEVLVVVAVIGVLMAVILYNFGDFRRSNVLSTESERILTILQC